MQKYRIWLSLCVLTLVVALGVSGYALDTSAATYERPQSVSVQERTQAASTTEFATYSVVYLPGEQFSYLHFEWAVAGEVTEFQLESGSEFSYGLATTTASNAVDAWAVIIEPVLFNTNYRVRVSMGGVYSDWSPYFTVGPSP